MGFDRALHDGEAEPGTARPTGDEGLEQPVLELGIDPGTVVGDPEPDGRIELASPGQLGGGGLAWLLFSRSARPARPTRVTGNFPAVNLLLFHFVTR